MRADAAHGVLANDHGFAGNGLMVTSVGADGKTVAVSPGHAATLQDDYGTLMLNADGSYAYTSTLAGVLHQLQHPGIVPQDTFVYSVSVSDGHGNIGQSSLTATTVNPLQSYVRGADGNDVLSAPRQSLLGRIFGVDDPSILDGGNGNDVLKGATNWTS